MERHSFLQLVLPLSGSIELDIDGKVQVIGDGLAAVVPAGWRHTQQAATNHQALIVDIDVSLFGDDHWCPLQERLYVERSHAAQQLTKLLARSATQSNQPLNGNALNEAFLLCLDSDHQPLRALKAIEAIVDLAPLQQRSVDDMASACGLKASQFHEIFREKYSQTPHQWLTMKRLQAVKRELETSDMSLADLALSAGYSDQSALSRAFRNAFQIPLSEYRRNARH
jgi:AraC-like DNA-binding protein